jgi:hypothetical protein
VNLNIWDSNHGNQLHEILEHKTAQERPIIKPFLTKYKAIMKEIKSDESKLLDIQKSSDNVMANDVTEILLTQQQALSSEIQSSSVAFDTILTNLLETNDFTNDLTGFLPFILN